MQAKKLQSMTLNEFNKLEMEDSMTYELIDGAILMSPRPRFAHQRIQAYLLGKLFAFLEGSACSVITEAEIEYQENVIVPDLFVYCEEVALEIQRFKGIPKVVIEILSPSTAFYDMSRKMQLYEKMGIQEYWIVSPMSKSVTIHHFFEERSSVFTVDDLLLSQAIEGFGLNVNEMFQ